MSVFNPAHPDNIELAKSILKMGADNPYDEELRICRIIMRQKEQVVDKSSLENSFDLRGERSSLFITYIRDLVARKVITFTVNAEKGMVYVRLSPVMNLFLAEMAKK